MTLKPVTLSELAAMRGKSYAWAQKHWRELPIRRVPGPGRPAFVRADVEAMLAGEPAAEPQAAGRLGEAQATPGSIRQTPQPEAAKTPANDPLPEQFSPDLERLVRALGGN